MVGQEKITALIIEKGQNLISQLIPIISDIAFKTGIKNIGTPNVEFPSTCLPPDELQKIKNKRNNILSKLNSVTKNIENLSKIIDPLNVIVTTTTTTLKTVSAARFSSNIAMAAIPAAVPGALPASINTLKDLEDLLSPRIRKTKNDITNISTALDFINSLLFKLLNIIKDIDTYLANCSDPSTTPDLTPLNNYLTNIDNTFNQIQSTTPTSPLDLFYNGFILEIEEVPFTPTVKRIKAVAKNSQGIVLLQTPLSFTTTPQVLIEELKLIIDSSDLKAY